METNISIFVLEILKFLYFCIVAIIIFQVAKYPEKKNVYIYQISDKGQD